MKGDTGARTMNTDRTKLVPTDVKALRRALVGKKIKGIQLYQFSDGHGGKTGDPTIRLDDGTVIKFSVHEVEDASVYGIDVEVYPPAADAP